MIKALKNINHSLFFHTSDTEFAKICEEALKLGDYFPKIYDAIKSDQDRLALIKKQMRLLDKKFIADKTEDLPGMDFGVSEISPDSLLLESGRPRMKTELVLLFTVIRGYLGSVTSRDVQDRFADSMTLFSLFSNLNMKMPGATTILENINCLSSETNALIMRCQLEYILNSGLDDFKYVQFDSTSVEASSCWPTDAGIILRLLNRVYTYGSKLDNFGIAPIPLFYFDQWIKNMKELLFKINNTHGTKKKSKAKKIKPLYSDFLNTAHKAFEYLVRNFEIRKVAIKDVDILPSAKRQLMKIHDIMEDDLLAVSNVLYYSEERVFNNVTLPASDKILSISDTTAAFIKKGDRNPVIGYKPQLAKSKNGFITGILLESGNISDSASLLPLAQLHTKNTGVIPDFISADDGYSSKAGRDACLEYGVNDICLSGSVGKKITPEGLWMSEDYIMGRRERSAIESLIFTLKYVFHFGRLRRRGLENVRTEMTEKVIAYNFRKKIMLQEELSREKESAQLKKGA